MYRIEPVAHSFNKNSEEYDVFNRKRDSYMTIDGSNLRMENIYKNQSAIVRNNSRS
jgi:hypothetical protein